MPDDYPIERSAIILSANKSLPVKAIAVRVHAGATCSVDSRFGQTNVREMPCCGREKKRRGNSYHTFSITNLQSAHNLSSAPVIPSTLLEKHSASITPAHLIFLPDIIPLEVFSYLSFEHALYAFADDRLHRLLAERGASTESSTVALRPASGGTTSSVLSCAKKYSLI